jgi:hypothetical protein
MKRGNPYQRDQRDIYISATRMGLVQMALDALWRAASVLALLDGLGWERCTDTWLDSGLGI